MKATESRSGKFASVCAVRDVLLEPGIFRNAGAAADSVCRSPEARIRLRRFKIIETGKPVSVVRMWGVLFKPDILRDGEINRAGRVIAGAGFAE